MLVVIGIVAVLVGLLIPMVIGARYRARMVTCVSNLREIGQGLLRYATDNEGFYPPRGNTGSDSKGCTLYMGSAATDQRIYLKDYVDFNRLSCPFAPRSLDFNQTGITWVEWTYEMFGGFQLQMPGAKGAFKVGKPFTYNGKSYLVLAGDEQWDWTNAATADPSGYVSEGEHPTTGMDALTGPSSVWPNVLFTRWNNTAKLRGPVDLNFLFQDGSVTTLPKVAFNYWLSTDPNYRQDVAAIPVWANNTASAWKAAVPAGN